MGSTLCIRRFTVVADLTQDLFEIVECEHDEVGITELNRRYPPGLGWMVVDSAETLAQAKRIIAEHRAEPRMDFE